MESMGSYLRGLGIDAAVEEEPAENFMGETVTESVIRIKGKDIDRIRMVSTDYISCGVMGSVSRFQYQVIVDKNLPDTAEQLINSKTKPVKENKILGLFGGKIADIRWTGGSLASRLNSDGEIKRVLLHCARSWGHAEFQITVISPTLIEILGPRFTESYWIPQVDTSEGKRGFEDCVFGFEIADHIARHVRSIISYRKTNH
jgi:hypothetical protein